MKINIDNNDLMRIIANCYDGGGNYDMSETKVENILAYYCDDYLYEMDFGELIDVIRFSSMYYLEDTPGKLNMKDFENDFSYLYPWEEYINDTEERNCMTPDKEDWYNEIVNLISPDFAIMTEDGIIVFD